MANCWIFQASPKTYDIISDLEDSDEVSPWTIRQYSEEVEYGDIAFIWKSDAGEGNAGIYAVAKVISDVALLPEIWGRKYWRNQADIKVEPRVLLRLTKNLVHAPILKTTLLTNPVLKDLTIIKQPQGTIFEVTDSQRAELNKMLSSL